MQKKTSAGEDAEDGGAAAGHGGVEGAAAVEVVLEGGDGGVGREDGGLEVVDDEVAPFPDGAADSLAEVGALLTPQSFGQLPLGRGAARWPLQALPLLRGSTP